MKEVFENLLFMAVIFREIVLEQRFYSKKYKKILLVRNGIFILEKGDFYHDITVFFVEKIRIITASINQ